MLVVFLNNIYILSARIDTRNYISIISDYLKTICINMDKLAYWSKNGGSAPSGIALLVMIYGEEILYYIRTESKLWDRRLEHLNLSTHAFRRKIEITPELT